MAHVMADPYTSAGGSPPHAMACPGPGEAGPPRRSTTSAPPHRSMNGPFHSASAQATAPRSTGSATPPAAWTPAAPVTPTNATPASTPVPSGAAPWGAPTVPGR
ncbi:hypothetical protein Acsp03_18000 [Actinomadura sp. NBRC 104412]|nr:hypothetical protein Acsp03_18000 [Actinomadura sp. NBRC 104412]